MTLMEDLHELNAGGHVLGVVGTDPVQLGHEVRGDALGLAQLEPAMDDTMADTGHVGETDMAFEPADQKVCCGTMTGCGDD
jgi:hypothetical protein